MEFTVNRLALLKELQLCASVIEKRSVIPITECVLITDAPNGIEVRGTDTQITSASTVPATVPNGAKGFAVVVSDLIEVIRSLDGEDVSFTSEPGRVEIMGGEATFHLPARHADDFPSAPTIGESAGARSISGEGFAFLLKSTIYAAVDAEARFGLVGPVLTFDERSARAIATDEGRIAFATTAATGTGASARGVLPLKAATVAARMVDPEAIVVVEFGDMSTSISCIGETARTLFVRKRDFTLPDLDAWQAQLKFKPEVAIVSRASLMSAIRRCLIASPKHSRGVRLLFTKGRLALTGEGGDGKAAQDAIQIDYDGEEIPIGFNGRYVLDALEPLDSGLVTIALQTGSNACCKIEPVKTSSDETYAIVMHMRI